ncbi:MAG: phosphoribosylglycinamide formyltransferase [Desulfobacterales bacterium]|nr:phosphoribosylglycinamide formyltransferase [Desulfobacterales bacterium]
MADQIRIGALISGGGTNLQAVMDACESCRISGKIVFVGSDNARAPGLERAAARRIPTFVVDYAAVFNSFKQAPGQVRPPDDFDLNDIFLKQSLFTDRDDPAKVKSFLTCRAIAEAGLLEEMKPYPFDLLILAGFMRNLTPYFIDRVNLPGGNPRIMNIHPALLPAFPGVDGYGDTFRYGCKVGGCTVHFIDYGEDSGPIIGQKAFQILEEDTLESVKEKGLKLEWQLYPECIRLFAQGRLKIVRPEQTLAGAKKSARNVVKIL